MTRLINADDFFRTFPELAIEPYINAPTIEERPQGEWIMNKTSVRGRNYTCTNCKKVSRNKFNFCPNCGADMREADNDKV